MRYEWDEHKNRLNQQKHHGVSFELGIGVFADPNFYLGLDRIDETTGEQRWHAIGKVAPTCSWLYTFTERMAMAKTLSDSSQPELLVSMTSEDIKNRKWTEQELELFDRLAAKQAAGDDSDINFDDIPELTDEQWAGMVRFRDRKKVPVSVRLDPQVLAWLKAKGAGHLTRINDILANVMEAEQRAGSRR